MKTVPKLSVEQAARWFKACSDPVRLRLLNLLHGREVCVCHLHEALELPQPTVSRHLAYLRTSGLVTTRKEGLWVHYRLAKPNGPVHTRLLESVKALGDADMMAQDQARLARLTCC